MGRTAASGGSRSRAGWPRRRRRAKAQWEQQRRANLVADRRIGENDPAMGEEERYLRRFQQEASRRALKRSRYNLNDDDDDGDGVDAQEDEDEDQLLTLTHGGKPIDDFDAVDELAVRRPRKPTKGELRNQDADVYELDSDLDDADEAFMQARYHFGEGVGNGSKAAAGHPGDAEREPLPSQQRTHAEIMQEVMLKAKMHKAERQREKALVERDTEQLDLQLSSVLGMLPKRDFGTPSAALGKPKQLKVPVPEPLSDAASPQDKNAEYDRHVRELLAEHRAAAASNRLLTEEQVAERELEEMRKLEKMRLRRMQGDEEPGSSDGDSAGGYRKKRKRNQRQTSTADDLDAEDDFILGREVDEDQADVSDQDSSNDGSAKIERREYETASSSSSSAAEEDEHDGDFGDSAATPASTAALSEWYASHRFVHDDEIPFIFASCPSTLAELLELFADKSPRQRALVVSRLRKCFSSKLGGRGPQANRALRATLLELLLQRIEKVGRWLTHSSPTKQSAADLQAVELVLLEVDMLLPEIYGMCIEDSVVPLIRWATKILRSVFDRMRSDLESSGPGVNKHERGDGTAMSGSFAVDFEECRPLDARELLLLHVVGRLFPKSDFRHPITSAAELLLAQSLCHARMPSLGDVLKNTLAACMLQSWLSEGGRTSGELVWFCKSVLSRVLPEPSSGRIQAEDEETKRDGDDLRGDSFVDVDSILPNLASQLSPAVLMRSAASNGRLVSFSVPRCMWSDGENGAESLAEQILAGVLMCVRKICAAQDGAHGNDGFPQYIAPVQNELHRLVKRMRARDLPTHLLEAVEETTSVVESAVGAMRRAPLQLYVQKQAAPKLLNPRIQAESAAHWRSQPEQSDAQRADELKRLAKRVRREERSAMREVRKDAAVMQRERFNQKLRADERGAAKAKEILTFMENQQRNYKQQVRTKKKLTGSKKW
ncbi:Nucleolar protein 14 [Porphyridium purpureum]|uniref:Nucleolar protein 14 n=1 Tax=Porphyridium purpureum TaxID=35688 RepID=A0A5J4Z4U3_PORPP|nr:Nucleolar protein 14 [Porphyridium purpureum]|eukprot:POR7482..scf295_1